jgi:alkanesulfonate monooxygenase SsuD/methylene tetrahydromethanopterin reductase-like flavin-dependent oxidoreductase (luciferase family)
MPLLSPEDAARHPDLPLARSMPSNRIVGEPDTVGAALAELIARTAADEIMISTMTHGLAERVRTLELVAEHWDRE